MPTFELQERAPQPVLVIRLHSPVAEIPAQFAVALPEVWRAAEAMGLAPSGPPFGRYLSDFAAELLDYEAGVHAAGTRAGSARAG